jgi:hypothetical protein
MTRGPDTNLWDPDRLRLPPGLVGTPRPRPPRHAPGDSFLRGPIPFAWIAAACRLPGAGLHVAIATRLLRERYRRGRDRRWDLATIAAGLCISIDSTRRGLHAAERAGLISVARKPGRKILAADVKLGECATGLGPNRRPLYGPIPWRWLLPALRLPGPALRVAMACWLVAGWERSAEFELALGQWGELGLSRQAAGRGLRSLEGAGLVEVTRPRGGPVSVRLRG